MREAKGGGFDRGTPAPLGDGVRISALSALFAALSALSVLSTLSTLFSPSPTRSPPSPPSRPSRPSQPTRPSRPSPPSNCRPSAAWRLGCGAARGLPSPPARPARPRVPPHPWRPSRLRPGGGPGVPGVAASGQGWPSRCSFRPSRRVASRGYTTRRDSANPASGQWAANHPIPPSRHATGAALPRGPPGRAEPATSPAPGRHEATRIPRSPAGGSGLGG
jgi:hypothetical protein